MNAFTNEQSGKAGQREFEKQSYKSIHPAPKAPASDSSAT
jgi:hypothetical protein